MFFKLRAIVSLDVFNLTVKEVMESVQEITAASRAVGRVHPRKGQFGVLVDGGHDVAFLALVVAHHRVQAYEKTGAGFLCEVGDLLSFHRQHSFAVHPCLFHRVVVQTRALNDALDLPARHGLVIRIRFPVQHKELHLAIADMRSTQTDDPPVLERRVFPHPSFDGCS